MQGSTVTLVEVTTLFPLFSVTVVFLASLKSEVSGHT